MILSIYDFERYFEHDLMPALLDAQASRLISAIELSGSVLLDAKNYRTVLFFPTVFECENSNITLSPDAILCLERTPKYLSYKVTDNIANWHTDIKPSVFEYLREHAREYPFYFKFFPESTLLLHADTNLVKALEKHETLKPLADEIKSIIKYGETRVLVLIGAKND